MYMGMGISLPQQSKNCDRFNIFFQHLQQQRSLSFKVYTYDRIEWGCVVS